MMRGPNSPNLSSLHYQVGGNDGVLTKPAIEAETSSRVLKCTLVNLVWLIGERH